MPVRDRQFRQVAFQTNNLRIGKAFRASRADGSNIFRPDDAYDIVDETSQNLYRRAIVLHRLREGTVDAEPAEFTLGGFKCGTPSCLL